LTNFNIVSNHLLPDKLDTHVISKMRHPPGTHYRIAALNVTSLSYIMPSVIIKHNNPLRIVYIAVLSRSMYLLDSIA